MLSNISTFIKNWTLPVSMISGAMLYFIGAALPISQDVKTDTIECIEFIQPILLFAMLFVAFCKVSPKDLKPHRWHLWLLIIQCGLFAAITLFLWAMPETAMRYSVESLMLALLCPTATACAVVTQKLGGDAAPTTSYTIMINIAISILAPLLLPIAHPQTGMSFFPAFITIMCKVFPLLIMPLVAAWGVRYYMPALHKRILAVRDLAFYMWAVALALAITVSCRALVNSHAGVWNISGIALATLIACAFQFIVGKRIGKTYGTTIECGQALGQKNTIFLIWMGYTFLSPVTAIAGGFYSIWQNSFNSYQLYKYRKKA